MGEPKNILFLVNRNIYYRHFGPFIRQLQKKKHKIHLLHDYSQTRAGVKSGYFPALSSVPQFEGEISFIGLYHSSGDIIEFVKSHRIEFIFSLNSYYHHKIQIKEIRPCKWVVLQHWADNFIHGFEDVFGCDHFLSYSLYWWDSFLTSKYSSTELETQVLPKVHHIGHPLNFLINELDTCSIKKKYNLHPAKGVLTYMPIGTPHMYLFQSLIQRLWLVYHYSSLPKKNPLEVILSILSQCIFRSAKTAVKERDIVLALRKFCDKNALTLVVKSRFKTPLSEFIIRHADAVLYDETFYPPTISEVLFVSDIAVSHFSMANFESIAMKSFAININLEPVFEPFSGLLTDCFKNEWINDFNTEGMSSIINADDFIRDFGDTPLTAFKFEDRNYNYFMTKYFTDVDSAIFEKSIDTILDGNP